MALDDLLAKLEQGAGTAGTAGVPVAVPANLLQTLGGTAGTAGTAEKDKERDGFAEMPATDTAPPIRASHWMLHFADREPLEVFFSPPADHSEALAYRGDAVAAEPQPAPAFPQSAHESAQQSTTRGCKSCRHCRRPGLSAGYCGERNDLPPAYTDGHPLRLLPDDLGADCTHWGRHE